MFHRKHANAIGAGSVLSPSTGLIEAPELIRDVDDSRASSRMKENQDRDHELPLYNRDHDANDCKGTLTRAGLARAIVDRRQGFSLLDAKSLVDQVIDEIASALALGETPRFRNFGSFIVRKKAARPGRNPRTGAVAPVTARKVVIFRASPTMKAVVAGEASPKTSEKRREPPVRLINLERRARFRRFDSPAPTQQFAMRQLAD